MEALTGPVSLAVIALAELASPSVVKNALPVLLPEGADPAAALAVQVVAAHLVPLSAAVPAPMRTPSPSLISIFLPLRKPT